MKMGVRYSSMVQSMVDLSSYISFQPVFHDWPCYVLCMCCGAYRWSLAINRKVAAAGFLSHHLSDPLPYVWHRITEQNVLSVLWNKKIPYFSCKKKIRIFNIKAYIGTKCMVKPALAQWQRSVRCHRAACTTDPHCVKRRQQISQHVLLNNYITYGGCSHQLHA